MKITELPTPAVVIETSRVARNVDAMQRAADAAGFLLRPHAKTHKLPAIARQQIARGAVGICCAKPSEAMVFAGAGIDDIRIPYPVHPSKHEQILALMDRTRLSIIVDDADVAVAWAGVMAKAGRTLDVLVKVDVGFHRCGVDPVSPDATHLIALVATLPGLKLRGLLSHAGHGYHAGSESALKLIAEEEVNAMTRLAAHARNKGITIEEISIGSTPTARFSLTHAGPTEMRPGNYVYFDRTQVGLGAASVDDCALTVLASVVAKHGDRIILDSGSKTLTSDGARGFSPLAGHGALSPSPASRLAPHDAFTIERLSEEHATVRVAAGGPSLAIGDLVRVIPNHSCTVSNLVDAVHLVDSEQVVETVPVAARGCIV
ncbi:MAG: alanine racemase [Acidobacteriota bacterium]|nr:alanine racemase [Acidobacteriota bacterium]